MSKKSAERLKIEKLLAQVQTGLRLANEIVCKAIAERDRLFAQHDLLTGLLDSKVKPVSTSQKLKAAVKSGSINKSLDTPLDDWAAESVAKAGKTVKER